MKWAGSEYEIVLEKLEMLDSWKAEMDRVGVKEVILDWRRGKTSWTAYW